MPLNAHVTHHHHGEDQSNHEAAADALEDPEPAREGNEFATRVGVGAAHQAIALTLAATLRSARPQVCPIIAAVEGEDASRRMSGGYALAARQSSPSLFGAGRHAPDDLRLREQTSPRSHAAGETLPRSSPSHWDSSPKPSMPLSASRRSAPSASGFQEHTPLELREVRALPRGWRWRCWKQIAPRGERMLGSSGWRVPQNLGACIRSLREACRLPGKKSLEPLHPV